MSMRISSFLSRHSYSSIPSIAIVTPIALACSTPAFCGEIHDATKAGNLAKAKALLKENPNLVLSKDNIGGMPLHWAAYGGHKEAAC
jgi:ankyrin repeat protein